MKVRNNHCRESQSSFQATVVESSVDLLQGTESFGGRSSEQPKREYDSVQQTEKTYQRC